jgi:hypothetical protein
MKAIPWNIQGLRRGSGVEDGKNPLNRLQQIRPYPAPVAAFIKPSEAPVLETPDHQYTT